MAGSNYTCRAAYNDDRNPTSYMSGAGYTDDRNITSYGENGYSDHVCRPVIVDADRRKWPIISYGSPNASKESYMSGEGYTDDRNITSYGENGYSDHVCRPVIVDADGRKRPIISYGSPIAIKESFVTTRTERIVKHVRAPVVVADYNTYSSQARVEPLKEYGVTNDKRSNPSTTVYDRPEYWYNSPPKMEPVSNYGVANDNWRGSSLYTGQDRPEYRYNSPSKMEPVRNYGVANDNGRGSSLNAGQDRPEYGYNSPSKMEPVRNYGATNDNGRGSSLNASQDRPEYGYNSPSKMEPVRNYGATNDNGRGSSLNAGQDRPEYGYYSPSKMEPVRNYGATNDNGHGSSLNAGQDRPQKVENFVTKVQTEVSRPTRIGLLSADLWRNPPSSKAQGYGATNGYGGEYANNNNNNQLSGPINEIGKAPEILKDEAKPSSIATAALQSRLPVLASTITPKRDSSTDTINSREAAKKYGNRNLASRPSQTEESYTGTIDSTEAAKRYNGIQWEQPNFVNACIDMEGKFRKYYEEMSPIFMLATAMDPRIKLEGVNLLLREIGTNLGITTLPSSAVVNELLNTMYAKYDSKFGFNVTHTAAPLTYSTSTNDASWILLISSLGIGSSNVTSRAELSKYLELESINMNDRLNFDILAWWGKNEEKYPVLSIMARDLLTPPVSSVASESAFSAGKRVLDERSRLAPDILDCLICLKDWEDARLGIEKRSTKDEFRGYFADSDIEND
ncbi:hypothetical protein RHSIM_Rhsim10G0110300 [Rhododendron simsii]|uniref:HAT C-terminal dimerisation domain-containing protein n=1 Tax=Rhododendron simsii TaxID=118357 RepID=A0A834GAS5_RHOSS|nr:hypothetical protein RHSIM_Rhsim10G0110300 [Rhododendron simsii]